MSRDSDHRENRGAANSPAADCPSTAALTAFTSGTLSGHELLTIADHASHCAAYEQAIRIQRFRTDFGYHREVLRCTSRFLTSSACISMNSRRGSIGSPIGCDRRLRRGAETVPARAAVARRVHKANGPNPVS